MPLSSKSEAGRATELGALVGEIRRCRICVETPKSAPLPHEPRPVLRPSVSARVLVCGQAPGVRVHASGVPFTDPSGERLRSWLDVDEATFYDQTRIAIVPMGFCFPGHDGKGGDLPPRPECAHHWHARLFQAMPKIELIVAVGLYAHAFHLGPRRARNLTDTVSRWRTYCAPGTVPAVVPTPHPSWRNNAWLRRNPWFERELLVDLRARVKALL